jgi:hypothetical protein
MYGGSDVTVRVALCGTGLMFAAQEIFEKFHNTDEPFEWLEKAEHGEFPEITFVGRLA